MVGDFDSNAMGCLFNKGKKEGGKDESTEQKSKEYSWDKRVKLNIEDYTIENVEDGEKGRLPGTVNGQQIIIKNCKDARIYVFDHMNTVTIDDCTNCKIILGPIKGSVFLRDCKNCVCVLACGQFRVRDCRKMDIFLLCATQPIIESSTGIHFACLRLFYTNLEDHFKKSKLSFYNNNWSNIHDFTPMEGGGSNWCLLPSSIKIEDYMPLPSTEDFVAMNTSLSASDSVVPYTHGPQKMPDSESCLVVVFFHDKQAEQTRTLINSIRTQSPECLLMRTKEIQLQQNDGQRIFSSADFNERMGKGPVVGLHFNGPNCIQLCQKAADVVAGTADSKKLLYLGTNAQTSHAQVEGFFNYANMQLDG